MQSRFYSPEQGRFLNADSYPSTGQGILGNNMFAYCNNNPASFEDPTGNSAIAAGFGGLPLILPAIDGPLPLGDIVLTVIVLLALAEGVEEASDWSQSRSFARSISLESGDGYDAHHIVAKADRRASLAYDVLISVGLDPRTDGLNLAVIPRSMHASLHTNSYYAYINRRFAGLQGNHEAVIFTLVELQLEIFLYCQTGLKAW